MSIADQRTRIVLHTRCSTSCSPSHPVTHSTILSLACKMLQLFQEMLDNYNTFGGETPKWYLSMLEEHGVSEEYIYPDA